ncbi:MAG: hypothetical protein RLZZ350_1951 [Verrucomicrobiota bacterium]|jgi:hypothetical protein
MIIDLKTGDLFSDSGRFLKRLHCPKNAAWDSMTDSVLPDARICQVCTRLVHDTAAMTEDDVAQLLERNPAACLKISLTQTNCTVLPSI